MNTPTGNILLKIAALTAGLILSTADAAADVDLPWAVKTTISKTVDVRDLDITTPEGARAAYERIVAAASSICVTPIDLPVLKTTTERRYEEKCVDRAVAEAVARTDASAGIDLLALARGAYDEESGRLASAR